MTAVLRHPRHAQGKRPQSRAATTPQKKVGRPPKGAPSTIVNLRIPMDVLAQLDRSIDRLEVQTGLKANRGMIARRALVRLLETRATGTSVLAL